MGNEIMGGHNVYIYMALMFGVTYLIRVLPLTLIRREIKNKTLRSFLYYVPYVTLAVMTFPAMMDSTQIPWSGLAALIICIILAWKGADLFRVAVAACAIVFVIELVYNYIVI